MGNCTKPNIRHGLSAAIFFVQTCLPAEAGATKKYFRFYPCYAGQEEFFSALIFKEIIASVSSDDTKRNGE